jgi:hypothetical protein
MTLAAIAPAGASRRTTPPLIHRPQVRPRPSREGQRLLTHLLVPNALLQPASRLDPSPYGVTSWHATDHTCDRLADLGVKWVRMPVMWRWHEPAEGQFNWETEDWGGAGKLDTWIDQLAGRGYSISVCVMSPPEWAKEHVGGLPLPDKMAAFCTALARRYDGKIACYEILADETFFLPQDRDRQAVSYVPILKACYQAIKAVNSKNLVACCGIWGPHGDTAYMTYLGELYRAGAKGFFDVANIHFYTGNDDAEDPRPSLTFHLACLRWVMERYGDQGKSIWLTEFGYAVPHDSQNNGKYTEEEQATYLHDTLDICRESGLVSKVFWYQFRNNDGMALISTHYEGEEGSDDHTRPAFYTYKSYIAGYPTWPAKSRTPPWQVDRANSVSIQNAGFENGTTGWSGNVAQDTTYAHSGRASGKITGLSKETVAYHAVVLEEDAFAYLLTGYVRANPNVPARMGIAFTGDDPGEWLTHYVTNTVYQPTAPGEEWTLLQIAVPVPEGAKKAIVYIVARSGEGDIWFDDIELVPYVQSNPRQHFTLD